MEQLKQSTLTETEQLRQDMLKRLEHLDGEIELHRRGGKLPVSLIHEWHLITRSIIELLGVRKPVTERLEVRKRTVSFTTSVVSKDGKVSAPKTFEIEQKQLALTEGNHAT